MNSLFENDVIKVTNVTNVTDINNDKEVTDVTNVSGLKFLEYFSNVKEICHFSDGNGNDDINQIITNLLFKYILSTNTHGGTISDMNNIDIIKLMMNMEQAFWYYVDFYSDKDATLPKYNFKSFTLQMLRYWMVINPSVMIYTRGFELNKLIKKHKDYRKSVPSYGAILLNPEMTKCVIVKSWNKNVWNFPKGKINNYQSDSDSCESCENEIECAIREIKEELSFDISNQINQNLYLENIFKGKLSKLFIIPNVSLTTHFKTQTRKEIDEIKWMLIDNIPYENQKPNKTNRHLWPLTKFERSLRNWIKNKKGRSIKIYLKR